MAKKLTTILDIGSSSIVTLIGERGINNSFKIVGKGEASYDGFSNGKFFLPEQVKNVVALSMSNAELSGGHKINEVFIGVPGEFCNCKVVDTTLDFYKSKKIRQADVDELISKGAVKHPTYTTINKSAVYYSLDGDKRVINPIGKQSSQLSGRISYMLAENNFIDFFTNIFLELGIKHIYFISSVLAEMIYLLDADTRDKYALLVDVGYLTTNVMLGHGDGLLFLNSFSMGGGYISGDLAQVLKISFNKAESLKRKVALSWQAGENDTYEVMGKEFISTYSAKIVNEIAEDRLEIIARYIDKCISKCKWEIPDDLPLYLTGGGISYMKGIKDLLNRKLGRKVIIIAGTKDHMDRPDYSSEFALLDAAISQTENDFSLIYSTRW